ncbi:MAG: ASCH domain-containing protein [Candidatus Yanofskybacteria bacterium]|nr:ASCH domain-containing protein [Candidatus Yanofskybacteria bacterium]
MKPALQALLIAPDCCVRDQIVWGTKTVTIREGHRDYKLGKVMLCCHLEPWAVMADITEVRHCLLKEVTKEECFDDGFSNRVELLHDLQRFYPDLTANSPVTVIKWANVTGTLVPKRNAC